ncbi:copper homeostasis CutC domain-containing protein [Aspergillus coremiiformis]|uniref:Copper homeostasis protein cutC homolog n=1 Tax=Aspergillus coremiiformis TaxID=138285 RepID=A0A5N6Z615_9EURO|nr:copper homeostasis CutC domain-containing protein [Aspergillus coremiiformis]
MEQTTTVPTNRPLLEIACFNAESAVIAARAGADRIELCRDYASGGLSPEPETVRRLKGQISIPIYVMIRPHAESFYYSDTDFETMKRAMFTLKKQGADGFVFGLLTEATQHASGEVAPWIDIARNKELVQLAAGRPCTFHRAFDLIPESQWDTALADLAECGFTSILTSGGPSGKTAMECVDQLHNLIQERRKQLKGRVDDGRLPQILVGGGVRAANIEALWERTCAAAFHSAALDRWSVERVSDGEVNALKAVLDKTRE